MAPPTHPSAALSLRCGLLALAAVGCGEGVREGDLRQDGDLGMAPRIEALFGAGVDPAQVLARVDGDTVTVAAVTAWLDLHPTLTVSQAVDDLVELTLAAHQGRTLPSADRHEADGRMIGRARHWVRRQHANVPQPSDEAVAEGLEDPSFTMLWGVPTLRRASHLLLMPAEDATDADRQWARARMESVAVALRRIRETRPVLEHDLRAQHAELSADVEGRPVQAVFDGHLLFPRTWSGTASWIGHEAVVQPFADAVFADGVALGDVLGPVDSEFGTHVILYEDEEPALRLDSPDPVFFVQTYLHTEAVRLQMQPLMARLRDEVRVWIDPDAMGILATAGDDRLRLEQTLRQTQVQGNR